MRTSLNRLYSEETARQALEVHCNEYEQLLQAGLTDLSDWPLATVRAGSVKQAGYYSTTVFMFIQQCTRSTIIELQFGTPIYTAV